MEFKILGTGSATPVLQRNPSAFTLTIDNHVFLIDCGEGTQYRFLEHNVKYSRINHIFISHLHGDHYFGLIGLISSMNMQKRTETLHVFGPKGLDEILLIQLKYSGTKLGFNILFENTNSEKLSIVLENSVYKVESFPLKHRVPCTGFVFIQKASKRKIASNLLPDKFPVTYMQKLKNGEDIVDEFSNKIYKNSEYTLSGEKEKKFSYCSDTIYDETIIDYIKDSDLLYHESTFLDDQISRAQVTFHSTASQAAKIALLSNVHKLIIGHFSSRYKDLELFLQEAQLVFLNSNTAKEGDNYII